MANNNNGRNSLIGAAAIGLGLTAIKLLRQNREPDMHGQVVLITGGSRGLGFLLSHEFARHGARLVVCARNEQELAKARQELEQHGAEIFTIPCDIADRAQVRVMVQQVTEKFGWVDILVNNAGIITVGPIQAQTLE